MQGINDYMQPVCQLCIPSVVPGFGKILSFIDFSVWCKSVLFVVTVKCLEIEQAEVGRLVLDRSVTILRLIAIFSKVDDILLASFC